MHSWPPTNTAVAKYRRRNPANAADSCNERRMADVIVSRTRAIVFDFTNRIRTNDRPSSGVRSMNRLAQRGDIETYWTGALVLGRQTQTANETICFEQQISHRCDQICPPSQLESIVRRRRPVVRTSRRASQWNCHAASRAVSEEENQFISSNCDSPSIRPHILATFASRRRPLSASHRSACAVDRHSSSIPR